MSSYAMYEKGSTSSQPNKNDVKVALRLLQSNSYSNLNRKGDSRALGIQPHRLNSGVSWLFVFSLL